MNNEKADVAAGLFVLKFNQTPGPVNILVNRKGATVLKFTPPVNITDKPVRTDRLTFTYSSETENYYKEIFGEKWINDKGGATGIRDIGINNK